MAARRKNPTYRKNVKTTMHPAPQTSLTTSMHPFVQTGSATSMHPRGTRRDGHGVRKDRELRSEGAVMHSEIEVRAVCPGCGPLVLPAAGFQCELEASGPKGICELRCPVCSTTVLVPAVASSVDMLWRAGAGHMSGPVPFELLESH